MKILSLHTDYIKFKPLKKALKSIGELPESDKKEKHSKEALVIFTAVEKLDTDVNQVSEKLVSNIQEIADQVKTKNIVLYPYAHLSSNLASPDLAQKVLDETEKKLKSLKEFNVVRAPFGYYKEFEMKVKGHPLSELSREITIEGKKDEGDKSLDARMETASHLTYETARKMLNAEFVSISEVDKNESTLNWKNFTNVIDKDFLAKLEKEVNKNLEANLSVTIETLPRKEALEKCGKFYDNVVPKKFDDVRIVTIAGLPPEPCIHEHVFSTKEIGEKIVIKGAEKVGKDYYKIKIKVEGKEDLELYDPKKLLREISKTKLDTSKLKDNDHRILGQQMDLFSFSEVAPGMVFWHNNGLIIYNELVNYWREMHRKNNYQEISTPLILDKKLWQISGHWEKYKENIFLTKYEGRDFAVKPMNCPGGMLVFKNRPKSYKDLPLRVGEIGIVHRQELSGVLAGLFRVIRFTQDDAHIFCNEEQLESEIVGIMEMVDLFYKKFNLELDHVELSTRPAKRIGEDKVWDLAEKTLEDVLKKKKMKYKINAGDGAFYGPKIDFHIKDSLGRTWQTATIQLDFAMPERFELEYADKDGKMKRPVMLHRVIYGSVERFIGVLLEHTNGRLPTWLSPVQVKVLSFTDRNEKYSKEIFEKLKKEIPNLRIENDFSQNTVQSKVKEAEIMRVPYILVLGDREEKDKNVAVRKKGSGKIENMKLEEFVKIVREEVEKRL